MASLTKSTRTIQYVDGAGLRKTIRLMKLLGGKVSIKTAMEVKAKIETLNTAAIAGFSIDPETARWVASIGQTLHDKLAELDLIPKRAAVAPASLGTFLASYIAGRGDVKGSTSNVYEQTQRCLIEYFGEAKPLAAISAGDADEWRRWLATEDKRPNGEITRRKLGENTIRRRCGVARQFLRAAMRKRLIADNPFADMKGVTVRSNRSRDFFITRADAAKVLDACPDAQWRLIFALSRFGGLRCPSETLSLRWADIDLAAGRMVVLSPKTEHLEGGESRVVPIFPELKPYLEDADALASPGSKFVISRYRDSNSNLRTQLERIIRKAKLSPWPKLFQNLRASRATELAAEFPAHVAAEWLGHSTLVAQKHYWRVTEEDYDNAASNPTGALHKRCSTDPQRPATVGIELELIAASAESSGVSGQWEHARQDSNLRPTS